MAKGLPQVPHVHANRLMAPETPLQRKLPKMKNGLIVEVPPELGSKHINDLAARLILLSNSF